MQRLVLFFIVLCMLAGGGRALSQPANDDKADAREIAGASGQLTGSTIGATKETGEAAHGGNSGGASVWFQWRAPVTGDVAFNTSGSGFDTLLAVYEGANLVVENDDAVSSHTSVVEFSAIEGHAYLIAVDGYGGRTGSYVLNWRLGTAAPTDTFTQVSAGEIHTCGIYTTGKVVCWGSDYWGGDYYGQATPPAGTFTQISAGATYTCGIRTTDTVACWGADHYGEATPPTGTFIQVSAGVWHSCGIRDYGCCSACWGHNRPSVQTKPPGGAFAQISRHGE